MSFTEFPDKASHLIEIFLHSFFFGLTCSIHLTYNQLWISLDKYWLHPQGLSQLQAFKESFILCFIIGCLVVQTNLTLQRICFRTTPIPPTWSVYDPSTWTTHVLLSSLSSKPLWLEVNSAMKSARAWTFIAFLDWYLTSNSLSSIAHWINRPTASNLFIDFLSGWSVITTIKCAWK